MKSLGRETILAIVNDANAKVANMPSDATDATKNGVTAFTIAIELIGIYHKWIS